MNDSRCFGLLLNNWNAYRKHPREYSRHLCDFTRPAELVGNKPSRRASDSEAITLHSHTYHGVDNLRKRHLRMGRKESAGDGTPQAKVYTLDKTFHRKFGHKGRQEETLYDSGLAVIPHQIANRKQTPGNSFYSGMGEGEKSFCVPVSSFACSSTVYAGVEIRTPKLDDELPTKNEKYEAIEKWLDCLPKLPIRY